MSKQKMKEKIIKTYTDNFFKERFNIIDTKIENTIVYKFTYNAIINFLTFNVSPSQEHINAIYDQIYTDLNNFYLDKLLDIIKIEEN